MEINIHQTYSAIQRFVVGGSSELSQEIADAFFEFKRYETNYRKFSLSPSEKEELRRVVGAFGDLHAVGLEVMEEIEVLNLDSSVLLSEVNKLDDVLRESFQEKGSAIAHSAVEKRAVALEAERAIVVVRHNIRDYMRRPNPEVRDQLEKSQRELNRVSELLPEGDLSEGEVQSMKRFKDRLAKIEELRERLFESAETREKQLGEMQAMVIVINDLIDHTPLPLVADARKNAVLEAKKAGNYSFATIAILGLVGLVISGGAMLKIRKGLAGSIDALVEAIRRYALGDLNYQIDVRVVDELHDIAVMLNGMGASLLTSEDFRKKYKGRREVEDELQGERSIRLELEAEIGKLKATTDQRTADLTAELETAESRLQKEKADGEGKEGEYLDFKAEKEEQMRERIEELAQIKEAKAQAEEALERTKEKLVECEERCHTISSLSPIGIFKTDVIGNCYFVDEKWSEISGVSSMDAYNSGWWRIAQFDDRQRISDEWYSTTVDNSTYRTDCRLPNVDGRENWACAEIRAETNEEGRVTGYFGSIQDISEWKKKELDFHGLTAQLEQKIRERTAQYESTEKKLRSEIGARQQSEFEFQNMEQRIKERSTQLEDAKRRLKDENAACRRLEGELKKARAALEKEIEERSGALEAVNNELQVVTSEQEEKESEYSRLEEELRGKIELLSVELDSASKSMAREKKAGEALKADLIKAKAEIEDSAREHLATSVALESQLESEICTRQELAREFRLARESWEEQVLEEAARLDDARNKVKDEISNRRKLQSKHEKAQANAKRQMGERNARIEAAEKILMMERRTLRSAEVRGCEVERVADMDRPALCLPDRVGVIWLLA